MIRLWATNQRIEGSQGEVKFKLTVASRGQKGRGDLRSKARSIRSTGSTHDKALGDGWSSLAGTRRLAGWLGVSTEEADSAAEWREVFRRMLGSHARANRRDLESGKVVTTPHRTEHRFDRVEEHVEDENNRGTCLYGVSGRRRLLCTA